MRGEKMKIELKGKIHNRFDIEVKDITTGEIVQKGQAENIILDQTWTVINANSNAAWAPNIAFGRGTGTLAATRTAMFDQIASSTGVEVEKVLNGEGVACYRTTRLVLDPSSYVGETITEVGLSGGTAFLRTHALIKDSEGNPLSLGPKTATQEITIYATVFFTYNSGGYDIKPYINANNSFFNIFLGASLVSSHQFYAGSTSPTVNGMMLWVSSDGSATNQAVNTSPVTPYIACPFNVLDGKIKKTTLTRVQTSQGNGKIKSIGLHQCGTTNLNFLRMVIPNTAFPGWEFDNRQIGVGTGSQIVFNLTWDEARLDKAKAVYVDGIEQTSGVTWASGSVTFDTAPADQAIITADYWVDYIPKDIDHVLDVQFIITLAEGVA